MNTEAMNTSSKLPPDFSHKLAQLDAMLEANAPNIAVVLRDVHAALKADPDNVTLMSPEEKAIVIRGLKKQTVTEIVTSSKASGAAKKSLSKLTVNDL